jgi:hypothetical protein
MSASLNPMAAAFGIGSGAVAAAAAAAAAAVFGGPNVGSTSNTLASTGKQITLPVWKIKYIYFLKLLTVKQLQAHRLQVLVIILQINTNGWIELRQHISIEI